MIYLGCFRQSLNLPSVPTAMTAGYRGEGCWWSLAGADVVCPSSLLHKSIFQLHKSIFQLSVCTPSVAPFGWQSFLFNRFPLLLNFCFQMTKKKLFQTNLFVTPFLFQFELLRFFVEMLLVSSRSKSYFVQKPV